MLPTQSVRTQCNNSDDELNISNGGSDDEQSNNNSSTSASSRGRGKRDRGNAKVSRAVTKGRGRAKGQTTLNF